MLLHSQRFCLCYRVTQPVSHYAMSSTCVSKKTTSAPLSCLFLIFWMQHQRFLHGITNWLVKPICFVSNCGLYSKKSGVKKMKNLSRVFLDKHSKKKNTWKVSELNSRLSFYYHLPAVEKCLDKSLFLTFKIMCFVWQALIEPTKLVSIKNIF